MRVAVLGASPNRERYSNRAVRELRDHGHEVVPVAPAHKEIEGLPAVAKLGDVKDPLDTITVYVGPQHIGPLVEQIVAARPRRVILNPGAEAKVLSDALAAAGIPCVEACTLVMLRTRQF
jgi:predicted CoA-binding protein